MRNKMHGVLKCQLSVPYVPVVPAMFQRCAGDFYEVDTAAICVGLSPYYATGIPVIRATEATD